MACLVRKATLTSTTLNLDLAACRVVNSSRKHPADLAPAHRYPQKQQAKWETTLVGGWATPLKNMNVNWDDYSQYMGK